MEEFARGFTPFLEEVHGILYIRVTVHRNTFIFK